MPNFPPEEIINLNNLLWTLLGPEGEDFLLIKETDTLNLLNQLSDDNYLELFRALNFYYPRRIAFEAIENTRTYSYNEYACNNELLLALTSIIDRLANSKDERAGYTNRFKDFLERNLHKSDLDELIKERYIFDNGQKIKINTIKEFAEYLYKVRSYIVHKAELGGLYPFNAMFDIDGISQGGKNSFALMIPPHYFRRLLWKAITKHLGLYLIG